MVGLFSCVAQSEFIYSIANKIFRMADMNAKGIQYVHLYEEGATRSSPSLVHL